MAKTYTTCVGMRGQRTARGGRNGCRASVQAYDGSVIVENWYDDETLKIRVALDDDSSCYGDTVFTGTFEEFKEAMKLLQDIKEKKVSVTRHREKSNKMKQLEKLFGGAN